MRGQEADEAEHALRGAVFKFRVLRLTALGSKIDLSRASGYYLRVIIPKGPCTQIGDTLAPKYPNRDYFKRLFGYIYP